MSDHINNHNTLKKTQLNQNYCPVCPGYRKKVQHGNSSILIHGNKMWISLFYFMAIKCEYRFYIVHSKFVSTSSKYKKCIVFGPTTLHQNINITHISNVCEHTHLPNNCHHIYDTWCVGRIHFTPQNTILRFSSFWQWRKHAGTVCKRVHTHSLFLCAQFHFAI